MSKSLKKVFLDCGAHNGESIDEFYRLFKDADEYEIHSFEPNPDMWPLLEKKKTILHKVGVWGDNDEIDYYKGENSEGGTFLRNKASGKVDYNNPIRAEVVRLSEWIKKNFDKEDYIILKIDIEGAEYWVLDDLFDTGMMSWINELYGELHGTGPNGRILSLPKSTYDGMVKRLDKADIELKDWYNNTKDRY
tara:strand:+ start:20528 stop:21103 length:576 start_codon:yes stop_codon:yes gene_type:complete